MVQLTCIPNQSSLKVNALRETINLVIDIVKLGGAKVIGKRTAFILLREMVFCLRFYKLFINDFNSKSEDATIFMAKTKLDILVIHNPIGVG